MTLPGNMGDRQGWSEGKKIVFNSSADGSWQSQNMALKDQKGGYVFIIGEVAESISGALIPVCLVGSTQ